MLLPMTSLTNKGIVVLPSSHVQEVLPRLPNARDSCLRLANTPQQICSGACKFQLESWRQMGRLCCRQLNNTALHVDLLSQVLVMCRLCMATTFEVLTQALHQFRTDKHCGGSHLLVSLCLPGRKLQPATCSVPLLLPSPSWLHVQFVNGRPSQR